MANDLTEVMYVRLTKELRKFLEQLAAERVSTVSTVAREAIADYRNRLDIQERDQYPLGRPEERSRQIDEERELENRESVM